MSLQSTKNICPTFARGLNSLLQWAKVHPEWSLLFLGSLIIRVLAIFVYRYPEFLQNGIVSLSETFDDQRTYLELSDNFLSRGEFSISVGPHKNHFFPNPGFIPYGYRPPVYTLFISFVRMFFGGHVLSIRLAQALVSSVVAPLAYQSAYILYERRTALLAGLFAMLYPFFIYWNLVIASLSLCIVVTSVGVLLIAYYLKHPSTKIFLYATAIFAFNGLIRPEGLYAGIASLFCMSVIHLRRFGKKGLSAIALAPCLIFMISLPWNIHNRMVFGSWGAVQEWVGENAFLYGTDYPFTRMDWPERDAILKEIESKIQTMPLAERKSYILKTWGLFCLHNPNMAFKAYTRKFLDYWKVVPYTHFHNMVKGLVYKNIYDSPVIRWASILSYGLLLPFFLLHLIRMPFRGWKDFTLAALLIAGAAMGTLTVSEIRIRNLTEIVVILFASVEIAKIKRPGGVGMKKSHARKTSLLDLQ